LLALLKGIVPNSKVLRSTFLTMLENARTRLQEIPVTVMEHNLDESLRIYDSFDAVVSSFAIHHLLDEQALLYVEIFNLEPGGVFCNLEHVASSTPLCISVFAAL